VKRFASTARGIVRGVTTVDRSQLELTFALRCSIGVAIPLVTGVLAGAPLSGSSAAYGALVVGFASRQGVHRTRAVAMILTALALALSGLAGALSGPHPIANLVLGTLWAVAFGFVSALGPSAGTASINGAVAFVLFSTAPYDTSDPWLQGTMIVAGGVLQTILIVAVWPLQRTRAEREALAAAYRSLALYASTVDADDLGLPDAAPLVRVHAILADPQPFGNRIDFAGFAALAEEAERIRATLAALASDYHLLADVGLTTPALALRRLTDAASAVLGAIALTLPAQRVPAPRALALADLDTALEAVTATLAARTPALRDARALVAQLHVAWRAAHAAAGQALPDYTRAPLAAASGAGLRDALETLRANATLRSTYARHALRLGAAMGVAIALAQRVPLAHAAWIGLTVALVLRPDFASTFTRGLGRVIGTIAGAAIAALLALADIAVGGFLALAVGFAFASYALFSISYTLFSVTITVYVVLLLVIGGAAEHAAASDRVIATILGGAVALVAYAIWPTWARERIRAELGALVQAQGAYALVVLDAFFDGKLDRAAMRERQRDVRRVRANAEAAIDQMRGEPVAERAIPLAAARGIVAAARRMSVATLALSARVTVIDPSERDALRTFVDDLRVVLARLVVALEATTSEDVPSLREDHRALVRAAREHDGPFIAEIDMIVDALETIATIVRRQSERSG
jgi:uncharacterized membrane protein YccC